MQTIYAFSYNPVIATGTNTTGTNWRMAYQQPIMLYKGTTNQFRLIVFSVNQKVVNLTNYSVQVQIVDRETKEHFVTKTATITTPVSGVATITFTEEDLRNLQHRFYHLIARLVDPDDGSSVSAGEILYLDDNYGAFTPITIEDAWNYNPTSISTVDGIPEISFTNIRETPDSFVGRAGSILTVNNTENSVQFSNSLSSFTIGNLLLSNSSISSNTGINLIFDSQIFSLVDNSTDPTHNVGDGGFFTFADNTHTNDGPTFEVWYGNVSNPFDPPGQHSLDIRAADANSYVELASYDLDTFIGIKNKEVFVQVDWLNDPEQGWIFRNDGSIRLSRQGMFRSFDNDVNIAVNNGFVDFNFTDALNVAHQTRFDRDGTSYFGGSLIPGEPNAFDLGSAENPWKDLYVSNSTIYLGDVALSVDNTGNLLIDGNVITGGGGGAVQPYLELTNDPFIFNKYDGPLVSFTKTNNGSQVDEIDTSIAITRGINQGIFNPYFESDWDDTTSDSPSPAGTLWNREGWGDLTNLNQRIYLSFYETFLRFGNNVLAAEAVMKDVANNTYYKFDFTVWGNANQGAPVTYTRTKIDPVSGEPIGNPVTFVKVGYADPTLVNDPIDTNLTIARGNQQSIYNIALETSYNTQGDGIDSPEGTEWNSDGWGQLRDVKQRTYDTFYNALGGQIGNNVVGAELIMHDTINDKYYAVKFSSWTQGGGGGFSYTRRLINTDNYFFKPDNDTNTIDIFVEDDGDGAGIGITRDSNNGIYNPYREGSWDEDVSPGGTFWNIDGWNDLTDITTRDYQPLYTAFGNGGLGNKIVGTECVMYIEDTDTYYAIKFLSWTQGGGGGFSYLRYEIDTTKLNEGITFADGTVLKSAEGIGNVKLRAPGNRRIEETAGYKQVSVTAVTTTNLTATVSQNGTSTNIIWIDATTTTIDSITDNFSTYNILNTTDIEFSIDNTNWYSWNGNTSFNGNQRGYGLNGNPQLTYLTGDTLYFRYRSGGAPVVWWNKNELPGGGSNFRGAVIDYHAYTGDATWVGTIHIVDDDGEENITHTEVSSGSTDGENDDLWYVTSEGQIKYRRLDGESATLKVQWTAKVFYGSEIFD